MKSEMKIFGIKCDVTTTMASISPNMYGVYTIRSDTLSYR